MAAVRKFDFSAGNGAITGLLGNNGAGKSTSLRMLATLLSPDSGRAHIDGIDLLRKPLAARRQLGYLPHNAGLYPRLSARENIDYYAQLSGLSRREAAAATARAIGLLQLEPLAERRVEGFSQGQRTKVALARALVHEPQTLLLDEPTSGLDVLATRGLRQLLRQLADNGRAVILSSHVMQEMEQLCDRLVVIHAGATLAAGSPVELMAATGTDTLEDAFVALIVAAGEEPT